MINVTELYDRYQTIIYYWGRSPYSLNNDDPVVLVPAPEGMEGLYITNRGHLYVINRRGVWPVRQCAECGLISSDYDLALTLPPEGPGMYESARRGCQGCAEALASGPPIRCPICGVVRVPDAPRTCPFCDSVCPSGVTRAA